MKRRLTGHSLVGVLDPLSRCAGVETLEGCFQRRRQVAKAVSTSAWRMSLIVLLLFTGTGCGQDQDHSTAAMGSSELLAKIDRRPGREAEYRPLLSTLAQRCEATRMDIADLSIVGVRQMKDAGVRMSALEFMQAMQEATAAGNFGSTCAEIAASLVVLTSHQ